MEGGLAHRAPHPYPRQGEDLRGHQADHEADVKGRALPDSCTSRFGTLHSKNVFLEKRILHLIKAVLLFMLYIFEPEGFE